MNARTRCDVYLLPRSQFRIWNQRPFSVNRATFQKLEMWARYKSMNLKNEERKEKTMSGRKHGTRGHPKASADLKFRNWEKNALYPACASRKHRLQWRIAIDKPTAFQTFINFFKAIRTDYPVRDIRGLYTRKDSTIILMLPCSQSWVQTSRHFFYAALRTTPTGDVQKTCLESLPA